MSPRRLRRLAAAALSAAAVALSLAVPGAAAQAATAGPHTSASGWTGLTLISGWVADSTPAVRTISGIVHFRGAMSTGGFTDEAFVLPKAFRPANFVFVPVDLCSATNGRLIISPSGDVSVQAEGSDFSNAQCLTSLDGAWFAP